MIANRCCRGLAGLGLLLAAAPAVALDELTYTIAAPTPEQGEEIGELLTGVSLLSAAESDGRTDAQALVGTALADYTQLLEALYTRGYYSGGINILIDGREAADIALLDLPERIGTISVRVETGPRFRFSKAELGPLPSRRTELADGFAVGKVAESTAIQESVDLAVTAWREDGHARAEIASEEVIARHSEARLEAMIGIRPGPLVSFGNMIVTTPSSVRESAIRRIAGFPAGERFAPSEVQRVVNRLRDTGAFSSVTLQEREALGPGDTLDMELAVSDQKPRRIGFGAEISTLEGAAVNAFWLHRNLFGGAERFRVEGSVSNIGSAESGIDYRLSGRLDVPAIYGPDTDGFVRALLADEDEPTYQSQRIEFEVGVTRALTDDLEVSLGTGLRYSDVQDDLGQREFFLVTFPGTATLDKRSNDLNPRQGYYIDATATPYLGFQDSESGGRVTADARYYLGFGDGDPNVLAARLQLGSIVGSELTGTPPDYLFYSGGGGTVRGQPYQSLNVDLGGGDETGGRSFLGLSTEFRRDITESLGAVAFYDAGFVGPDSFVSDAGDWHSGAGLGLRYQTGIGPIRFDVASPVSGDTGEGLQYYIGIGQAF